MNIKNIITLNRNSEGRFLSKYSKSIKLLCYLYVLVGIFYLLATASNYMVKNTLTIQKPIVLSIETRPMVVIEERKPLLLLSPYRITTKQPTTDNNLSKNEQIILDVFGVENYKVARALAVCESGMRAEAVNWDSHDIGLFQINWPTWEKAIKDEFGFTLVDMFDPEINARVAYWIFDRDNDGKGSIEPWVASTTQCFRDNL